MFTHTHKRSTTNGRVGDKLVGVRGFLFHMLLIYITFITYKRHYVSLAYMCMLGLHDIGQMRDIQYHNYLKYCYNDIICTI